MNEPIRDAALWLAQRAGGFDGRGRPRKPHTDRNREIAEARAKGGTLAEVGARYGITRERVRQICQRAGIRKPVRPPKPSPPLTICQFKRMVYKWLFEIGYQWCTFCRQAKPFSEFMPTHPQGTPCRECNSRRVNAYYHKHPDTARKWSRAHPDKGAEYCKRYNDKLRSTTEGLDTLRKRYTTSFKRYYAKLKANPVKWEACVTKSREVYKSIKSDPSKWAAYSAKKHEYYLRKRDQKADTPHA